MKLKYFSRRVEIFNDKKYLKSSRSHRRRRHAEDEDDADRPRSLGNENEKKES